jgi:predicted amidohydrolase YtcJ
VYPLGYPAVGEWILIDDRHVQRVGIGAPPPSDRVVRIEGTTILPGFVDCHVHLTSTGFALANGEVEGVRSADELLALARRRVAEGREVTLLSGFDETRWKEPRLPTLEELDAITSGPLAIRRIDGHVAIANSAAIRLADLEGERGAERDSHGSLTGRLTQEANARLARWGAQTFTDQEVQEFQLEAAARASSRGITTVHEMSMPHELGLRDLEVYLGHRDKLPVDSIVMVATTDIPQAMDLRLPSIGGDLPIDGSLGARTAWLSARYEDGEGTGASYYGDEELARFFLGGHTAGLQVGVHAIGDRAVEQALSCWEEVYATLDSRGRRHFRARRHRLEHFEMAAASQVERAVMLGLAASVQPAFDERWGHVDGLYERRVGAHRAHSMNPFRTMLERGLELGAGSDSPVTTLDPMSGIEALETHHDPSQRLTRTEAVRLWTIGGARLAHLEDKKGVLEPGMHADFAAWPADPIEEPSVGGLRPVITVSLGREVHAS